MATNTYISDPPYSQNSATYFYSNDQKVNFQGLRTSPVILKHFSAYLEYPNINLSGMVIFLKKNLKKKLISFSFFLFLFFIIF